MAGKIVVAIVVALIALALASGGDFNRNHAAAGPFTYTHSTGGGSWNDGTVGNTEDIKDSLEGDQFHCGDMVTHFIKFETLPSLKGTESVEMEIIMTADSTGQSGVAYGNLATWSINLPAPAKWENGDDGTGISPGPRKYGVDSAAKSNGNEVVKLVRKSLNKPIFTTTAELRFTVRIEGFEANEVVIFRYDVFIYCLPGSTPTGNLQSAINYCLALDSTGANVGAIGGGQQTVPLKNVNRILGIGCQPVAQPLVAQDFTANVVITTPAGGLQYTTMSYSWYTGAYVMQGLGTGSTELHTFESSCSIDHFGEYLYSQSACGCEGTKIPNDQAQLFFNATSPYYNQPPVSETINGVKVLHYTRTANQSVTDLWLNEATGAIVRARWRDGTIMDFSNVKYYTTPLPATTFASPADTCTCRRRTDIVIMLENSGTIFSDGLAAEASFAANLTKQFTLGTNNTLVSVYHYGAAPTQVLDINAGSTQTNVVNAINSISCAGSGRSPCGPGADGDVVAALNAAVNELTVDSKRSFVTKVVIFVTNGWQNTPTAVYNAVAAAEAAGVTIFVVSYETLMTAADMQILTGKYPDNLVQRYSSPYLISGDPLDVSSRVCLINKFPCGTGCCGLCDTACGQCKPVDACPLVSGCAYQTVLVGNCCVNATNGGCPPVPGVCADQKCNLATNKCESTPTCTAAQNTKCYNYACQNGTCVQTFLGPKDTNCTSYSCVANDIQATPASCPSNTKCKVYSCDEAKGGCVATDTVPSKPTNDPCLVDKCDPTTGWTTEEIAGCTVNGCTPVCDFQDKCSKNYCNVNTCAWQNVTCTPPNACFSAKCNPLVGCEYVEKDCDDKNPCTVDSCEASNGQCKNVQKNCTGTSKCHEAICNTTTGACDNKPLICNDNVNCTVDTCDPVKGCQFTLNDVFCDLQDACNTYLCDATLGCVGAPITCNEDGLNCTESTCVIYEGCNNQPVVCNISVAPSEENTNCSTVECKEDQGKCVLTEKECAVLSPPIIATVVALTAGVIAGIVIAVIAFVACSGGAAYAAFQKMNVGGADAVVNNPLYKGQGRQGVNPLFKNA